MKAYRYNPNTFIYEGEQERQLDPLGSIKAGRDVFLMPANCTDIEMQLEPKEGFDIIFLNNNWEYKKQPKKEEEPKISDYIPSLEDKLNMLDSKYESNKKTLSNYYIQFMIAEDEDGMNSIKEELSALASEYDETRLSIINEEGGND
mgnify:FL=1